MIGAEGKVMLTQVLQSDLVKFIEWHQNPEIVRQISDDLGEFMRPEDVAEHYLKMFRYPYGRLFMIKVRNSKKQFVPFGYIGANSIDMKNRKCHLHMIVAKQEIFKAGLAKEAINLFTDYLTNDVGMHRVDMITHVDRKDIIEAFLGVGFKMEAQKLRGFWYYDGKYQDACLLSKFFTAL